MPARRDEGSSVASLSSYRPGAALRLAYKARARHRTAPPKALPTRARRYPTSAKAERRTHARPKQPSSSFVRCLRSAQRHWFDDEGYHLAAKVAPHEGSFNREVENVDEREA